MAEPEKRALTDKFMLRLPDGMRERIKAVAEKNSRSMNAEIVATLEEKYPAKDRFDELYERAFSYLESIPEKERPEKLKIVIQILSWNGDENIREYNENIVRAMFKEDGLNVPDS